MTEVDTQAKMRVNVRNDFTMIYFIMASVFSQEEAHVTAHHLQRVNWIHIHRKFNSAFPHHVELTDSL